MLNIVSCSTSNKLSTNGINKPRLKISITDTINNNGTKIIKKNACHFCNRINFFYNHFNYYLIK